MNRRPLPLYYLALLSLFFANPMMTGCESREVYRPALTQWEKNLIRLRPTMEKGAAALPEDLRKSKMDLFDNTVRGIRRVNEKGPEVWKEEVKDEQ